MSSSSSAYHGQTFDVTGHEMDQKHDPYVYLEYGSSRWRTRTCKRGGRNPIFQEKFTISLIEGIKEMTLQVWNSHTLSRDSYIGSGRIQLQKLISQGIDDSSWPIVDRQNRSAGEVKLFLYCPALNVQKQPNDNLQPNVMSVPIYTNPPPCQQPPVVYPPNPQMHQGFFPPQPPPAAPDIPHSYSVVDPSHNMRDQVFPGSSYPQPVNNPPPGYPPN